MDPLIQSFRENESVETFQQFLDSVAPARSNAPAQPESAGQVFGEFLDTFAPIEQQEEEPREPPKAKPPATRKTKTETVKRKTEPPKRPEKKIAKQPAKEKIAKESAKTVEIPKVASINLDVYVCTQCCYDAQYQQQQ